MFANPARTVAVLLLAALVAAGGSAADQTEAARLAADGDAQGNDAQGNDAKGIEFFETHIRPVLVQHCYECHSADADAAMGGLRLDSSESALAGGDSGPALVPGDAEQSLLIRALRQDGLEMPPEGKLPEATIRHFEQWVQIGAPDPRRRDAAAANEKASADPQKHWSFQPLRRPAVPAVGDSRWPHTDIDRFVLAQLEDQGLTPVRDADRHALIRRATFDLWGLPPTPEAVQRFVDDPSPDAFAALVDRLLSAPAFGERWGRHWLDIARYAESTGQERNFLYPHAWRYRDYVIASLNDDKPYDQFILEQIAGDLLPADDPAQRDAQQTATGFLALGSRDLLTGTSESHQLHTADDQINVTSRAILGLTVACARCHDHKFDPIPTAEYYGLAGIFLSTETLYGTVPGTGGGSNRHPRELIPLGANAQQQHELVLEHQKRIAEATKALAKVEGQRKKLRSLPEKSLRQKQDQLQRVEQQYAERRAVLSELKKQAPPSPPYAMGVREAKEIADTAIRVAGDAGKRGDLAPRTVLSCITVGDRPTIPDQQSGRLALAQWLVDRQNPLTARVMVNRIWHHLLGRGLVTTVDNFGINGATPSHPELLDWLALQFQQDQWSIKQMIRRIMTSRVYQLAAAHQPASYAVDPDNRMLWRRTPKRLEAEAIRDAMLVVSGSLQRTPPAEGSVVATLGDGCLVRQINPDRLQTGDTYRSIYLPAVRFFTPEMLQVFDGVSPSLVAGARAATNVPSQALFLLNDPFVVEQAELAAADLTTKSNDRIEGVQKAFRRALGRAPTDAELKQSLRFLEEALRLSGADDAAVSEQARRQAWGGLVQALFASAEFRYVY